MAARESARWAVASACEDTMPLDSGVVSRLGRAARTTLRSAARMLVAATFGATLAPTALAQVASPGVV
jgi:hypothetical protein